MAIKNAKIYGKFYSPELVLSYNRPWIFIVGSRSIGKSTALGMYMILEYLKHGSKFIYVRRTEDEVMNTCRNFFDNSIAILRQNGYQIDDFKYDSKYYYIMINGEWEQCGCILPLSQEQKYKSANYQDYNTILFDEFISYDPNKYLGSKANFTYEYDRCLSLYQTVDRGIGQTFQNKTKFIFTANNSSYFNPLFIGLGITDYIRTDSKIIAPKNKLWIVEQISEVEATKDIKSSYAYQLSNEKNRDYAYNNIAFDETETFIGRIDKPMVCLINVMYNGHKMGIYYVKEDDMIYVSDRPGNVITLALTYGDHDSINYTLAKTFRDSPQMQVLREQYVRGNIMFQTPKCKYEICNYLMLT